MCGQLDWTGLDVRPRQQQLASVGFGTPLHWGGREQECSDHSCSCHLHAPSTTTVVGGTCIHACCSAPRQPQQTQLHPPAPRPTPDPPSTNSMHLDIYIQYTLYSMHAFPPTYYCIAAAGRPPLHAHPATLFPRSLCDSACVCDRQLYMHVSTHPPIPSNLNNLSCH